MADAAEYQISIQLCDTEDGRMYEARVTEFPDIATYGDTFQEAYTEAMVAIEGTVELLDSMNKLIPEPVERKSDYSGKFLARVPKSLHRDLAETASREGISLNQYVLSVLSCHSNWLRFDKREIAAPASIAALTRLDV